MSSRGSNPALTSDDLPQPEGRRSGRPGRRCPGRSTRSGSSRTGGYSGRPSRSRGPGSSSRKKSASCRSNDRSPLGTILTRPAVGVGSCRERTGPASPPGSRRAPSDRAGTTRAARRRGRTGSRRDVGLEEVPQVVGQVAAGAVPLRRPLRQHLLADPLQLAGDRVVDLAGRARLGGGDLVHHFGPRVAPERLAPGQQLVEDHAEAEDVRAAVDPVPLAAGLLGAHVGGRAGEPGSLAVVLVLQRQAEVGHPGLAWSDRSGCWRA